MKRIVMLGLAAAAAFSLSTVTLAHHGGAAFDQSQVLTFKGTVTEMTFTNPHILIYWETVKDGATEKWSDEEWAEAAGRSTQNSRRRSDSHLGGAWTL